MPGIYEPGPSWQAQMGLYEVVLWGRAHFVVHFVAHLVGSFSPQPPDKVGDKVEDKVPGHQTT